MIRRRRAGRHENAVSEIGMALLAVVTPPCLAVLSSKSLTSGRRMAGSDGPRRCQDDGRTRGTPQRRRPTEIGRRAASFLMI